MHNISCNFIQKNIALHLKNFSYTSSNRIKNFALYKRSSDISILSTDNDTGNRKNTSHSTLGQILFTVLTDSNVNAVNTSSYDPLLKQLTQITNAFQDEKKLVAKDISLAKCYRYLLSEQSLVKAEEFLSKANFWFPKNITPFIIFTSLVTDITANSFTTKKDSKIYKVQNKVSTTSPWIDLKKSAPYFLAVSAILDQDEKIFLKEAFALPIFNKTSIIPVESNYERTILKILFSTCRKYNNIIIEKPLLDLSTKDKKKYRPDFVLISNNQRIFVEVLGSSNIDYLAHKRYISQIAKSECHSYISIKAYELQTHYSDFVRSLEIALKHTQ